MAEKQALRERVRQALDDLGHRDSGQRINLTDQDARLMRTRQRIAPGYNAQAMVSPLGPDGQSTGMPITAVDLVDEPHDYARLLPMPEQAGEITGVKAPVTLAGAGYHSSTNLEKRAERDRVDHVAAWVHAVAGTPPRRAGTIAKPHAGKGMEFFTDTALRVKSSYTPNIRVSRFQCRLKIVSDGEC